MTFNQLFDEYLDIRGVHQSNAEVLNKVNRYEKHIRPFIGRLKLKKIKYKHCQSICNNIIYTLELSPKTAKNVNTVIQTVFNYAMFNDYVKSNPAQNVIFPKYDNKYNITLSLAQVQSLVDNIFAFDEELYRDIFIFALHGRRKTEVLSITWGQVDLDLKEYHIPPQKNKSRKHDIHSMTETLVDMFQKRYTKAKEHGLTRDKDYVFISPQTNTRLKDVKRPFIKLKKNANLSKFRFHDFRHLLATYTLNKKHMPIEHISQALGHSSIEVTQKYVTKDSTISKDICNSLLNDFVKVKK